jgi:hypothetical protein
MLRFELSEEACEENTGAPWLFSALCSETMSEDRNGDKDLLKWCLNTLDLSPAARLLIREAAHEGWRLGITDQCGYDFHLDVPEKLILLDNYGLLPEALTRSPYFRNILLVSLVRALRDAWQEKRHGGFDEHYGPEAILMLERVRAADCDVMAVLVAWELHGEGQPGLWRHLIGSEEGDMAMAFSQKLERDPASLFTGTALSAAFAQWYRNETRVNACDHESLEYIDSIMREGRGGESFGCRELTPVSIEVLSCLPDKTAYLRGKGREIATDPFYAGLHDTINQSHFLQVMHDLHVTYIHGIPFRDAGLADKIFPGGDFTDETRCYTKTS